MTTQSKPENTLNSFIEEVCGESHLRVESDLGGGFVRLRISEAEKRQAAQDIRSSEDVVIEMLRNARDAGAEHIFVALHREGNIRSILVLDDGMGIPQHMHKLVFEPRVTSKLNTAHMDKWGMHGRGMALYSISQNVMSSQVVYSEVNKGASLKVVSDLTRLSEKTDQSTFPVFELQESGVFAMRGPKNIIRTVAEFALEHRGECTVYCGSVAEICATLYAHGMSLSDPKERAFCSNRQEVEACLRLAYSSDPADMVNLAAGLGLDVSERTARRILSSEVAPLPSVLARLEKESFSSSHASKRSSKGHDSQSARFAKKDLEELSDRIAAAFSSLAQSYFLEEECEVAVRQRGDCLKITIPIRKR